MRAIFLLMLLSVGTISCAQDTTIRTEGLIYRKLLNWRMDEKRLTQAELKAEIYKTPAAILHYKKAATNKIFVYSLYVPAAAFLILSRNRSPFASASPPKNNTGYTVAAIFSSGALVYFIHRYHLNMKQAVRIRNENLKITY